MVFLLSLWLCLVVVMNVVALVATIFELFALDYVLVPYDKPEMVEKRGRHDIRACLGFFSTIWLVHHFSANHACVAGLKAGLVLGILWSIPLIFSSHQSQIKALQARIDFRAAIARDIGG